MTGTVGADVHILLRYGQSLSGLEDTIPAHQAVLGRYGAVLFGKVGRPFGKETVATVQREVAEQRSPFLFLAAKAGREFIVHRGQIAAMILDLSAEDRSLVPDYYARSAITGRIGTWFRLVSLDRISPATLKKVVVAKTGTPILSVLGSSRNSMFIVSLGTT